MKDSAELEKAYETAKAELDVATSHLKKQSKKISRAKKELKKAEEIQPHVAEKL